jgi:hypothetical protein
MIRAMKKLDRRRFLTLTAATLPTLRSISSLAQAPTKPATLTLHPGTPGPTVPSNFIGLSYEIQQLSEPTFFSAANTGLIRELRALAPHGVLRLGGNTSDIGFWTPTPGPRPPLPANVVLNEKTDFGQKSLELAYQVTPLAVTNLKAFLDATGWTCLYGINLGTNTPERAAAEAAFVAKTLGDKLEYFQIGNEPDMLEIRFRDPKTWSADKYYDDWLKLANAIRARVPSASFGLPDTADRPDWYATVVTRLLATPNPPPVACLSHHYYFGGPPANPNVNIPKLLQPDPRVDHLAADITAATARLSAGQHRTVPYRMTEGNTCHHGGKPGVSDVFASALWSADYLLKLASLGYAGVNLHGGDGVFVANSLGGKLPGDDIVLAEHGDPATHPHPYYTPIAHIGTEYIAEPVSYGMRFAGMFAGATMIPVDFDPGNVDATAYAAKLSNGSIVVAIINKDATQSLPLNLDNTLASTNAAVQNLPTEPHWVATHFLSGKSLDARAATFFGGPLPQTNSVSPSTAILFRRSNR